MRNCIRRSSGSSAWRSATPFWTATAALDSVDGARELDQRAVPCQLDHTAAVLGNQRLDELLAQRLQARDRPDLVSPDQPAIADHVRGQDRRKPAFHARGHAPACSRAAPNRRRAIL
jgi:hypothetical protein